MHVVSRPLCFVIAQLLYPVALLAAVGPNELCSMPRPYPSPDAAAGVVFNGNMESGFTGGWANQWVGWRTPAYPEFAPLVGSDRKFEGATSQKFHMRQPSSLKSQEGGMYQQVWVTPGATYTATAKIYLQPPAGQAYEGEDLVAWIGLDPYGQTVGGGGIVWAPSISTPNTWVTATLAVKAEMPVLTLCIKGTRKFAQHGNEAYIWIDQVVLSGPIPTGQRPGPEPDPIDPESLIPETVGDNKIVNSSFESAFANGVSTSWNKWSSVGSGTWKRSQRLGKIGGARYDCGSLDALGQMNAKTALFMTGNPENGNLGVMNDITYFITNYPVHEDAIIVGRPYIDQPVGTYMSNPEFYGRRLADLLVQKYSSAAWWPRVDAWQGLNESDTNDGWQPMLAFEMAYAQRLHELGLKIVAMNLSTGSPGNGWRITDESYNPSCRQLLEIADYLGHHVYGGPNDDLMLVNQQIDDACHFALRPRRFKDQFARRGWRYPPVIATEGSTWGANVPAWGDTTITNDLVTMGQYMSLNKWWCGYTNFVVGGSCSWLGFEIGNRPAIISAVSAFNLNNPADAVEGLYSQMFGSGKVHPKTAAENTPAGLFTGGINQSVTGLTPGKTYLAACWMKYEFKGMQPAQLKFHIGIDQTGQTANGAAGTIDWGIDQIADKARVHDIFTHVWRTFTASSAGVSIWLRASQPVANPSVMFYTDQIEVRAVDDGALPGPSILLSTSQIEASGQVGASLPSGQFTVANGGTDSITYTVSDNAAWIAVSPAGGTSTGEADAIQLTYNTAGLSPGAHAAAITVTAPGALNSPATVTINLTLLSIQADFDQDADVDQADFGHLQRCYTGAGNAQSNPACLNARLDGDDDVDVDDFAILQACLSGAGVAVAPGCGQ